MIFSKILSEIIGIRNWILLRLYRLRYIDLEILLQKRKLAYFETGIVATVPGKEAKSSVYCLFVYYEKQDDISDSAKRILTELNRQNVNTILLCNHELSKKQSEFISANCHKTIIRNNQGFDFGAYKDGVRFLSDKRIDVSRLIFLNDSVFFSSVGLSKFVSSLIEEYDAISAFENWGEDHHIQSFALSVSRRVVESAQFQEFWKKYKPVNNRVYAINQGEKKLSIAVLSAALTTHTVYSVGDLFNKLKDSKFSILDNLICFSQPYRQSMSEMSWSIETTTSEDETPAKNKKSANSTKTTFSERRLNYLYGKLCETINTTSPIHAGAYLFPKFLESPIFKKDIVYRNRFDFWEVESWVTGLMSERETAEYLDVLRRKSKSSSLSKRDQHLFNIGVK